MKKLLFVVLAIVLVLPMIVSCANTPDGEPVEITNVKVISYQNAYPEAETGAVAKPDKSLATELYSGTVTAYVVEGEKLTLKDVVDGYARDLDGSAVYDESTARYTKINDLAALDGWFWNYYVNGSESSLTAEVKAGDAIEIVFEK